jgi:hypothetical protein
VSPPLKPCPFCGGAPAFLKDNNHSTAWSVECLSDGCLLNPSVWGATAKAAVTAWNTRALEREAKAEPVAWAYVNPDGECEQIEWGPVFDDPHVTPLYASPPAPESE